MDSAGVSAIIGVVIIGSVFLAAAVVFMKFSDAIDDGTWVGLVSGLINLFFGIVSIGIFVWLAMNASSENVHNVWRAVRDGVIALVQAAWHWLAN